MGGSCTRDEGMWPKSKKCRASGEQGDSAHSPAGAWPGLAITPGPQEAEQRRAVSSEEGWGLAKGKLAKKDDGAQQHSSVVECPPINQVTV